VREMIEDKDRTKELPDAIAQGHQTYGMQTFDQSLMSHIRKGLIQYEEALRQATNPDDFALRFSGISATSDSNWDDFDQKPGEAKVVPGTVAHAQQAPPASTPRPASAAPAAKPPAVAKAATKEQPALDDEFKIDRF